MLHQIPKGASHSQGGPSTPPHPLKRKLNTDHQTLIKHSHLLGFFTSHFKREHSIFEQFVKIQLG